MVGVVGIRVMRVVVRCWKCLMMSERCEKSQNSNDVLETTISLDIFFFFLSCLRIIIVERCVITFVTDVWE
jgi:hypothetical protein